MDDMLLDATMRAWRIDERLGAVHLRLMQYLAGDRSAEETIRIIASDVEALFFEDGKVE